MITIHKYPFQIRNIIRIKMPRIFKILKVECQRQTPCIWAMVDLDAEEMEVVLTCYGTGEPIHHDWNDHVATFQEGPYVWHLFRNAQ